MRLVLVKRKVEDLRHQQWSPETLSCHLMLLLKSGKRVSERDRELTALTAAQRSVEPLSEFGFFGRREIVEEEEEKVHVSPSTYKAAPMEAEELSVKTYTIIGLLCWPSCTSLFLVHIMLQ